MWGNGGKGSSPKRNDDNVGSSSHLDDGHEYDYVRTTSPPTSVPTVLGNWINPNHDGASNKLPNPNNGGSNSDDADLTQTMVVLMNIMVAHFVSIYKNLIVRSTYKTYTNPQPWYPNNCYESYNSHTLAAAQTTLVAMQVVSVCQ